MNRHALGVTVSAEALHAVLLERTDEGAEVRLKVSSSRRNVEEADVPFADTDEGTAGLEDEPDDVTIQFGDEGGSDDLFLGSEFDDLDAGDEEYSASEGATEAWNFQAKLDDVLDQCVELGVEDPEIAFCETISEVDEVELRLPIDESDEETEGERGLSLPAPRSELLEMLDEQYDGGVDKERVGFIPMRKTGDGRQRVMALISRPGGPVQTTLRAAQKQTLARSPRVGVLDAETSLYLGLVRSVLQLPPNTPEKTILVRSRPEDTLVLFIEGNTLRQAEHLPELTSEDSAETICSRVLLLQDEYGMGEVQHLMLIAEENEGVLADAFKSYFASASLRLLRNHLPNGDSTESAGYIPATGVAIRLLDDPEYEPFFHVVDLLPKKLKASRFRLPVGWSVPALLVLLGVTTLGFVWYYFLNAQRISERQTELKHLERQVEQVNEQGLRRRIDSTKAAVVEYSDGLEVLDGLLRGSNKWSRRLASVTGRISEIQGISIGRWSPETDTTVTLSGHSRSRPGVVNLAQQLDGDINSLTFTQTRDVQLYEFNLTVPLDTTKPEAISYWRKQQLADASSTEVSDTVGVDSPAPLSAEAFADARSTDDAESDGASADAADDGASAAVTTSSTGENVGQDELWTVVVASFARNEDARQVARRYRNRLADSRFEIQVQHGVEDDRYRVGIGTFTTFEAAKNALDSLSANLPDDVWIHRYSVEGNESASVQELARRVASTRW